MDPVRHSAYVVAVGRHARVACSAFFLATTLAVGCVSLDKPTSVQKCVAAGNCSDNPNPQPGPDANQDAIESGPDSRSEDKPTTKEDLASDSPIPDAPADQADQGPDQKDVAGTDGTDTFVSTDVDSGLSPADQRDIAGTDGAETGNLADADSGQPIVDSRPDYGPDIVRQDVAPDLGPDVSPDTSTLGSGLLAYYTCEAATGTTLPDSSGKKNDATLVTGSAGTVGYSFAPGKIGNALDLVVVNQGYATLPATRLGFRHEFLRSLHVRNYHQQQHEQCSCQVRDHHQRQCHGRRADCRGASAAADQEVDARGCRAGFDWSRAVCRRSAGRSEYRGHATPGRPWQHHQQLHRTLAVSCGSVPGWRYRRFPRLQSGAVARGNPGARVRFVGTLLGTVICVPRSTLGVRKVVGEILPQIRGDSELESAWLNGESADQCFRSRFSFSLR